MTLQVLFLPFMAVQTGLLNLIKFLYMFILIIKQILVGRLTVR